MMCFGFSICIMSLRSSLPPCPETWASLKILGFDFLSRPSIFKNCSLFTSTGITLDEKIMLSSLFSLNGRSCLDSLSRIEPGSPWCPVHTIM